eukprot:1095985_1
MYTTRCSFLLDFIFAFQIAVRSHITCGREFRSVLFKREIKQEIVQLSTHMTEHKGQRNILSNGFIVFIYGFATVIMVDVSHMFCAICFATPFHSHSISMVFL